jgi:hypothetical protein
LATAALTIDLSHHPLRVVFSLPLTNPPFFGKVGHLFIAKGASMSDPVRLSIRHNRQAVAWVVVYLESRGIKKPAKRGNKTVMVEAVEPVPDHRSKPEILRVTSEDVTRYGLIELCLAPGGQEIAMRWVQAIKPEKPDEFEMRTLRITNPRRATSIIDTLHFYQSGEHVHSHNVVAFYSEQQAIAFKLALLKR